MPSFPTHLTRLLQGLFTLLLTLFGLLLVTFALSACGYIGTALVAGFVGNKIDQKVRVMR